MPHHGSGLGNLANQSLKGMGPWRLRDQATSVPFFADLTKHIWSNRTMAHRR